MDVLIFLIVLIALILVHEAGHFFVAKMVGMRVDEFGLGYPPRALTLTKRRGTEYTLNWLPFGGFVRIYGEDSVGIEHDGAVSKVHGSFVSKPRWAQALVLVAGVTMNMLFAWVLLTGALMMGTPRALTPSEVSRAHDLSMIVGEVVPQSPAAQAGVIAGDTITRAQIGTATWTGANPDTFTAFIGTDHGQPVTLTVAHNATTHTLVVTPARGIIPSEPNRYALGVGVSSVGVLPLSFVEAVKEGTALTWEVTRTTAIGLGQFLMHAVTFTANLSQVSGPVGIASAVGTAAQQGPGDLLSLVALISINLAIINLIPIPALDGGRLLFVIVEAVTRRPIKPRIAQTVNTVGFALIIILMVVVTAHDIFRLVA